MLHSFKGKKEINHLCLTTNEDASDPNSSNDGGNGNMSEGKEEAKEDSTKF